MSDERWMIKIEGGLAAHFIQPDGSSRPGVDWAVALKRDEQIHKVLVRTYLSEDATHEFRSDTAAHVSAVMNWVNNLILDGWTPDQPRDLTLILEDPSRAGCRSIKKSWWRFW